MDAVQFSDAKTLLLVGLIIYVIKIIRSPPPPQPAQPIVVHVAQPMPVQDAPDTTDKSLDSSHESTPVFVTPKHSHVDKSTTQTQVNSRAVPNKRSASAGPGPLRPAHSLSLTPLSYLNNPEFTRSKLSWEHFHHQGNVHLVLFDAMTNMNSLHDLCSATY